MTTKEPLFPLPWRVNLHIGDDSPPTLHSSDGKIIAVLSTGSFQYGAYPDDSVMKVKRKVDALLQSDEPARIITTLGFHSIDTAEELEELLNHCNALAKAGTEMDCDAAFKVLSDFARYWNDPFRLDVEEDDD